MQTRNIEFDEELYEKLQQLALKKKKKILHLIFELINIGLESKKK